MNVAITNKLRIDANAAHLNFQHLLRSESFVLEKDNKFLRSDMHVSRSVCDEKTCGDKMTLAVENAGLN